MTKSATPDISFEELHRQFSYDPVTGTISRGACMTKYLILYHDGDKYDWKIVRREAVPQHSELFDYTWDLPVGCDVISVAQIVGDIASVRTA